MNILQVLKTSPVIPVITVHQVKHAVPLAKALVSGGLRVLEVTLRTDVALEAIAVMRRQVPEAIVGAGTVLKAEQFTELKKIDAQFAVSPGFTVKLVHAAQDNEIPYLPGTATISEMMQARELGFSAVKLFPAEVIGGIKLLKAAISVLPDMLFCPTGGVNEHNAQNYLDLKNVITVGGSWVVPQDVIERADWPTITKLAKECSNLNP